MQYLHNSRHRFLVQIFSILIVSIDTLCAYVKGKSSSQHLSDQWRRTNCDELIKVPSPLLLIARGKIWPEHVIHLILAGDLRP